MPFVVSWHGFILTRAAIENPDATWWTAIQGEQFMRYEVAGRRVRGDWSHWARRLFGATDADADWLEYSDPNAGVYRGVLLKDNRMSACLFLSPRPDLPSRTWLSSLFARERIEDQDRAGLLMGQPSDPQADTGPTVCSCFGVGRKTICNAIKRYKLTTPQQVGQKLKAGTNCGSCVGEIKVLLSEMQETE
jgi:assimilatory nitrate reductase catalytic subunit